MSIFTLASLTLELVTSMVGVKLREGSFDGLGLSEGDKLTVGRGVGSSIGDEVVGTGSNTSVVVLIVVNCVGLVVGTTLGSFVVVKPGAPVVV